MRRKYVLKWQSMTIIGEMFVMKIVTGAIIEEVTIITIVETLVEGVLAEGTSETEILGEETSEIETLDVEILAEGTSETEILGVEILAEEISETRIQGTALGLEKRRFLQIMIGLAQNVTTPIFPSVKNVTGVVSQKVATWAEVTTEAHEIVNQEITDQAGMTESQENLEKQEVNLQITPITGDQNRLMLVLEEEIAMIK